MIFIILVSSLRNTHTYTHIFMNDHWLTMTFMYGDLLVMLLFNYEGKINRSRRSNNNKKKSLLIVMY
jgi:hypothetical protein